MFWALIRKIFSPFFLLHRFHGQVLGESVKENVEIFRWWCKKDSKMEKYKRKTLLRRPKLTMWYTCRKFIVTSKRDFGPYLWLQSREPQKMPRSALISIHVQIYLSAWRFICVWLGQKRGRETRIAKEGKQNALKWKIMLLKTWRNDRVAPEIYWRQYSLGFNTLKNF